MPAINVKVKTDKVVAALETKLAALVADQTRYDTEMELYNSKIAERNKEIVALVIGKEPDSVHVHGYAWHPSATKIELTWRAEFLNIPALPDRPEYNHDVRMISELESAIRLLKMTDEPTVNASTFKQISKFL